MNKYFQVFVSCLIIMGLLSCTPTTKKALQHPQGFACYENAAPMKAVSPEGIVYRVRYEKNKPFAELPFWKEALKKRMTDAGYGFSRESDIQAGDRKGYLLELTAPMGPRDNAYLMAIFLNDMKQIVIFEASGEITQFDAQREKILDAVRSSAF